MDAAATVRPPRGGDAYVRAPDATHLFYVPPYTPLYLPPPPAAHEMGYWEQQAQQNPAQQNPTQPQPAQPQPSQPQPAYGAAPAYGQQPYGYPASGYQPTPTPGSATASLVLGIIGLASVMVCGIGLFCSPFALWQGYKARNLIEASNGRLGGRSTATAGIVMGWIGTVLLVLGLILLIIIIAVGVSGGFDSGSSTDYGNV